MPVPVPGPLIDRVDAVILFRYAVFARPSRNCMPSIAMS